jgi:outer membrane protein OmpA-like peptidoglycan-associated protein
MMRRLLLLAAAALAAGIPLSAETFRFAYTKGEKYRILSTVTESVFKNGRLSNKAEILNKIAAEVTDTQAGSGYHKVSYNTSTRGSGSIGTYGWAEEYFSEFWRDDRGVYDIADTYFMPVVRDVPAFPEGEVTVGQSWTAPASEAHDFRRNFGIESVFRFPITVNYAYLRNEIKNGVDCAVIAISYTVFYKVPAPFRASADYPARITASSRQTFWWDRVNKRPYLDEEEFDFVFTQIGGDEIEFVGESRGELLEAPPLDREKVTRDIQKEIEDRKIPDTSVRADARGVTITLDNINFPPNSGALLPAEKEKLARIAQILKAYPGRDLLITGHTAAVAGYTKEQHQALSEERARAVGDYLLSLGARKPEGMSVKGMGNTAPIADNSTEAGRMKNRRVEITILEN